MRKNPSEQTLTKKGKLLFCEMKNYMPSCSNRTIALFMRVSAVRPIYIPKWPPKKFIEFNPESRILIILRNPIERAYSHYLMAQQMGFEASGFLSALKRDMRKKNKAWGVSELYYELGEYSAQIKRYQVLFPKGQLKVVLFEDWIQQPKETQESICKFLNVSIFAALKNDVQNKSVSPKNPKMHRFLTQSGLKDLAKKVLPKNFFNKLKGGQYKGDIEVLAPDERKYLTNLYRDEILELQDLLKRDLSNWLK